MKITITLQDVRAALDVVGVVGISFSGGDLTDFDLLRTDLRDDLSLDSLDVIWLVSILEDRVGVKISPMGIARFAVQAQTVENFLQMVNDYQE